MDGGFAWVPFAQTADHDAPAVLGPVRHDYVKFLLVDSDGRRFALREEDIATEHLGWVVSAFARLCSSLHFPIPA